MAQIAAKEQLVTVGRHKPLIIRKEADHFKISKSVTAITVS
jgi:hypothetical protein